MIDLTIYALPIIFAVSVVLILVASEIGHYFGLRVAREANISTLEAAMLGLLALLISFTFAMAMTHFDERRDAVLNEANAIRTAALRARLLPVPQNAHSLKLLRDYVQIRLDIAGREPTPNQMNAVIARSNEIQGALWSEVKSAMAKDNAMVPTGLFVQALNNMFDDQEKRLTALRNRVPNIVLLALYGVAVVAIGFTGYASGTAGRRWRLPVYIMSVLVASVILLIQDLDRPGAGFVSVSQQPVIDTAAGLASYSVEFEDSAPQRPKQ